MQDIALIDDHRADLRLAIESMPATALLGLKVVGLGQGVSLLEMPLRRDLTFDGHTVQGGIVGTLADYAAVSAVTAALPPGWAAATTGFEVHNLEPARGATLLAVGRAIQAGKGLSLGEARVYAIEQEMDGPAAAAVAGGRLVAMALATCRAYEVPSFRQQPQ